jgi:spermidine synthase
VTKIVATLQEDGQTIAVRRDGDRYDVVLGNVVLLSSAALETERAFGALAARAPVPRVLLGGLGFGATARGALDALPADGRVIVVEKLAAIERLARGDLAHLVPPGTLEDPRLSIVRADVADVIASEKDLGGILLDVDNGPEWASFRTNARLYSAPHLAAARAALAPRGLYAVWSGYPADPFLARLRAAGFTAETVPLHERGVLRARAYVGTRRE